MNAIPPRRRRASRLAQVACLLFAAQAQAATFVVTNRFDAGTGGCTAAECTLREAIVAANATATADFINFSFREVAGKEILIQPTSPLPALTQPVTVDGYSVSGAQANTLAEGSNAVLRIRIDGANAGAGADGLAICASDVTIRGLSLTGFDSRALSLGGNCAVTHTGIVVAGNFVGLRVDGTAAVGNNTGMELRRGSVRIGGPLPAERNVVAASTGAGIHVINGQSAGSRIEGNLFGTDRTGTLDRGNGGAGLLFDISATGIDVGASAAPNLFAHNGSGIKSSANSGIANTWYANRFFANAGPGIDLANDGVTANDDDDADIGPNNRQNFPLIDSASRTAGGVSTSLTLEVGNVVGQNYRIALYASSACDASGHGEGERLLTDQSRALSTSSQSFTLSAATAEPLPIGTMLTATATALDGSSSEFSPCFPLDPPPRVVNSVADPGSGGCTVAECTLREAITAANAGSAGSIHSIVFDIDGPGPHVIAPTAPLPTITRTTSIDGYSQPGASPNTLAEGSNAVLQVRIDGIDAGPAATGLAVCGTDAEQSEIRGLSITRFAQHGLSLGGRSDGSFCGAVPADLRLTGNLVGLAPGGSVAGNAGSGIRTGTRAIIGGPAPGDRNVVSANGSGILVIDAPSSGTQVFGNYIGLDPGGTQARGNATDGIVVSSGATLVDIGEGAPNRIAFNRAGILVLGSATRASISGNRIHSNTGLGIDLSLAGLPDGVTANDLDDSDAGPNGLQNFPDLTLAQRSETGLRIAGSVEVGLFPDGGDVLSIAVYANSSCDPGGHGEGERYLGASDVFTGFTTANFDFELVVDDPLPPGTQITATATHESGVTSEFSSCIAATDPPPGLVVTTIDDTDGATCGPTCTLRQAINAANAQPGADLISFSIPGLGPFPITLQGNPLPTITEALVIDGYTQLGAFPNTTDAGSNAVILIELRGSGPDRGLAVCADDVAIRGLSITGFADEAVAIGADAQANACPQPPRGGRLAGNFFGLLADGTTSASTRGVLLSNAVAEIGGLAPADRNLFATAGNVGLRLQGAAAAGSTVRGNLFGTDASGTADRGSSLAALVLADATGITVGHLAAPNRFLFNEAGILVADSSQANTLHANEFSQQDTVAINLCPVGACPSAGDANDADDTDIGGNGLQNFPVLDGAVAGAGGLAVQGTLDVPAVAGNAAYTIALYESAACDASGNGEGEILLGAQAVVLSNAAEGFDIVLPIAAPAPGRIVTATATDPAGNTSEFSPCVAVTAGPEIFVDGFEG